MKKRYVAGFLGASVLLLFVTNGINSSYKSQKVEKSKLEKLLNDANDNASVSMQNYNVKYAEYDKAKAAAQKEKANGGSDVSSSDDSDDSQETSTTLTNDQVVVGVLKKFFNIDSGIEKDDYSNRYKSSQITFSKDAITQFTQDADSYSNYASISTSVNSVIYDLKNNNDADTYTGKVIVSVYDTNSNKTSYKIFDYSMTLDRTDDVVTVEKLSITQEQASVSDSSSTSSSTSSSSSKG